MNETNYTLQPYTIEPSWNTLITPSPHNSRVEDIGDHSLNSTISNLRHRFELLTESEPGKIESKHGRTQIKHYCLPISEHEKTRRVLEQMSKRHLNRKR